MTRVLLFYIALFIFVGAQSIPGQEVQGLKDRRVSLDFEQKPLGVVLEYLIVKYDIPVGLEQSTLDNGHGDYDFGTNLPMAASITGQNIEGAKVRIMSQKSYERFSHLLTIRAENEPLTEVLDTIVKQMKNYSWRIEDDVVNIFPSKGQDERLRRMLDMTVKSFIFNGGTVGDITTKIKTLDELKDFLEQNNLVFTGVRNGSEMLLKARYDRQIDSKMKFSDIKFRNLLNQITKVKRGGWIVKFVRVYNAQPRHKIDIDI